MGYLIWFTIVLLLFLVMHYFTELNTKQKAAISATVTLVILGAIFYSILKTQDQELVISLQEKYDQKMVLMCGDIEVDYKNFDYSVGTQSFIGHKDSKYPNKIINIRECR